MSAAPAAESVPVGLPVTSPKPATPVVSSVAPRATNSAVPAMSVIPGRRVTITPIRSQRPTRCVLWAAAPVGQKTADELVKRLIPRVEGLKVGPSTDSSADFGPLVTRAHLEKVKGYIDSVEQEGGRIATGGVGDVLSDYNAQELSEAQMAAAVARSIMARTGSQRLEREINESIVSLRREQDGEHDEDHEDDGALQEIKRHGAAGDGLPFQQQDGDRQRQQTGQHVSMG